MLVVLLPPLWSGEFHNWHRSIMPSSGNPLQNPSGPDSIYTCTTTENHFRRTVSTTVLKTVGEEHSLLGRATLFL